MEENLAIVYIVDDDEGIRTCIQSLTPREKEVLRAVLEGKASKIIARDLDISVKTVDVHRASIKEKLNIANTATLVSSCRTLPFRRGRRDVRRERKIRQLRRCPYCHRPLVSIA